MSLPVSKRSKENANNEAYDMDVTKEAKTIMEKILGDVSKTSATKQIVIGTASGWVTGFLTMKVGKVVAFAVGGGIIILQVAAHQGYVKINWDKFQKKAEKITDKVEEKITGEGPKFMDKVERFVDKELDKAEQLLKNGESRTRGWYHKITGDDTFRPREIHFFLASYAAGLAIGFATANWVMNCCILNVSKITGGEKIPIETIDLVERKKTVGTVEFDDLITDIREKFDDILQWINERVKEFL